METRVSCIRTWLNGIDSSLLKYQDDFEKLDFINSNCVKFLCQSDFKKFEVYPSDLHQRMILNAVAKLQTPNSKKGLEHVQEARRLAPQKLFDERNSSDFGWDENKGNGSASPSWSDFEYKSPTELMMTELEENLKIKRVELESAKTYLSDLKERYCSDSVIIDKTIPQCSKCHLRDGHSRRRCPWGECQGPESCSDVDKHPNEKKMLLESSADCRAKESEIQKIERDIANKKIAITETQTSFKYRVMSTLINTNINKYTFSTTAGRALRQTTINNDVYILEKHYKGKVPVDLKDAAKNFQSIINDFNGKHTDQQGSRGSRNPMQKILENHNVEFPLFTPRVTTTPTMRRAGNELQTCVPPKKTIYLLNSCIKEKTIFRVTVFVNFKFKIKRKHHI